MVDFNEDTPIVVSDHAAKRWAQRVGANISVDEAKRVIAEGIRQNGRLVMQSYGKTVYYEWLGLIFPMCPNRRNPAERVVKTTLLWGM